MADVTISNLPLGAPSGNALLPYSQGGNTLAVAASAILQVAGNVGIGTVNPQFKLHVYNTSDVTLALDKPTGASVQFQNSTGRSFQIDENAGALRFINKDLVEKMRIDQSGNVTVAGDVRATNTPKAWASFNGKAAIGTNQPIRASYNITSILRADDANYIVTFPAGVFSNANYAFVGSSSTALQRASVVSGPILDAPTATTFRFANFSLVYTGQPAGWINESAEYISIAFFAL